MRLRRFDQNSAMRIDTRIRTDSVAGFGCHRPPSVGCWTMDGLELARIVNGIEAAILDIAALKRLIAQSPSDANKTKWHETLQILEGRRVMLQSVLTAATQIQ